VADGIVLYQVDDKVGIITLNRPEKLNAISRELQLALTEAFARADADPATSVCCCVPKVVAFAPATTSAPSPRELTTGGATRPKRMHISNRSSNSRWRRG
jgi:Enoyl-CoA hydratase/carnithine racemase